MCQGFADHFKSNYIDSGNSASLKSKFIELYDSYCVNRNNAECSFLKHDVHVAILNLAKNKACGNDGICAEHLIYAASAIAQPLCDLFNACIVNGCVPDSFALSE